jgi:PKD repeat protein
LTLLLLVILVLPNAADATLLASTFLGGSGEEGGYCSDAVALAPDGTVYVTGHTASTDFPKTTGDPYHGGASDVFVCRFDRTMTDLLAAIYLGGSNEEQASCILVDASGSVYVSGGTMSNDFPTTATAHDTTYNGGISGPYDVPGDIFITKLSADLETIEASTYFGGTACDYSRAIVLSGSTVFVTGATASSGLATAGAFDETRTLGGDTWGGIDAYVASFDATSLSRTAATYLGGGGQDYCEDMDLTAGGVYVTGWTQSDNYPFTPTAFDTTYAGGVYDAFVTGLDPSLTSLVGSTYLGGTSWDFGYAIATDASGHVYVTGHNAELGDETTFPTTTGAFQEEYNGIGGAGVGDDAFVSKFDGTLSTLVASTMFGGTGWEYGTGLKWDPDGYIWIVGTTTSEDIPRHTGAYQYDYAGDDGAGNTGEGFVSRLSDDLTSLDTSTYLGGSGNDTPECIVLDADGNAYVTGYTTSQDFPSMHGSYEEDWQGGSSDAFVSVLSRYLGAIGLSAGPQYGLPPLAVDLSGTAPAGSVPDSWGWDVDDDGSIDTTGQSAAWTYGSPGTYSVRLVLTYGPFTPSVALEDAVLVFDESSALRFGGASERATCTATPELNLKGDLTLEAWIMPDGWGGFPFGQMGFGQVLSKGPISLHLVGVHAMYNDNSLCLALGHGDGTASVSLSPVGSMALDQWQHVAATYDTATSTVRMWIDGVEQVVTYSVAPSGGVADNAADDLLIGNTSTLNKGFEGVIDEVSVWDIARDPGDIEAGRDYPLFGDEPGLVGYWRMDEAGGDTLTDGSGGGNDASRIEAAWAQGVVLHATGVDPGGGDAVFATALLRPNYPNPFTPRTTISFSLPAPGEARVAVYDVAGRLVRTLVNAPMAAGPHSVEWDGRAEDGSRAASGVYFCRLSTPSGTASSRMVMVR